MSTPRKALVDVRLGESGLVIVPRGIWKLWSFCRRLHIPYGSIADARLSSSPDRELEPRWRNPGLGTVGALAGYTNGSRGRAWWCYRYGSSAVVLDLDLPRLQNAVFVATSEVDLLSEIRSRATSLGDRIGDR